MRLPKSVLGVLAAGALLLGGAVPAVAEDAVPGDGPTTSASAPADEVGRGVESEDVDGSAGGGDGAAGRDGASQSRARSAVDRAAVGSYDDSTLKVDFRIINLEPDNTINDNSEFWVEKTVNATVDLKVSGSGADAIIRNPWLMITVPKGKIKDLKFADSQNAYQTVQILEDQVDPDNAYIIYKYDQFTGASSAAYPAPFLFDGAKTSDGDKITVKAVVLDATGVENRNDADKKSVLETAKSLPVLYSAEKTYKARKIEATYNWANLATDNGNPFHDGGQRRRLVYDQSLTDDNGKVVKENNQIFVYRKLDTADSQTTGEDGQKARFTFSFVINPPAVEGNQSWYFNKPQTLTAVFKLPDNVEPARATLRDKGEAQCDGSSRWFYDKATNTLSLREKNGNYGGSSAWRWDRLGRSYVSDVYLRLKNVPYWDGSKDSIEERNAKLVNIPIDFIMDQGLDSENKFYSSTAHLLVEKEVYQGAGTFSTSKMYRNSWATASDIYLGGGSYEQPLNLLGGNYTIRNGVISDRLGNDQSQIGLYYNTDLNNTNNGSSPTNPDGGAVNKIVSYEDYLDIPEKIQAGEQGNTYYEKFQINNIFFRNNNLPSADDAKRQEKADATINQVNSTSNTLYGIKGDGSKIAIAKNLKYRQVVDIHDTARQYKGLSLEFDDPLVLDNVSLNILTSIQPTVEEKAKYNSPGYAPHEYRTGYKVTFRDVNDKEATWDRPRDPGALTNINTITPRVRMGVPNDVSVPFKAEGTFVDYRFTLAGYAGDGNWGALSEYTGGAVVLLPPAFSYAGTTEKFGDYNNEELGDKRNPQVIENYKGTGRTALIYSDIRFVPKSTVLDDLILAPKLEVSKYAQRGNNQVDVYYLYDHNDEIKPLGESQYYADELDLDNDGDTTELFAHMASQINYIPPLEMVVTHQVGMDLNTMALATTGDLGYDYRYGITMLNNTINDVTSAHVIGVLPQKGDKVIAPNQAGEYGDRGSTYGVTLSKFLEDEEENIEPLKRFDVYYQTQSHQGDINGLRDGSWLTKEEVGDVSKVKAYKLVLKPGEVIKAKEEIKLYTTAKIPFDTTLIPEEEENADVAVSTLAFSTDGQIFSEGNKVQTRYTSYEVNGRYFFDKDKDGVYEEGTDTPLANRTLTLVSNEAALDRDAESVPGEVLNPDGSKIEIETNAEGKYSAPVYRRGEYRLYTEKSHFEDFVTAVPASPEAGAEVQNLDAATIEGDTGKTTGFALNPASRVATRNVAVTGDPGSITVTKTAASEDDNPDSGKPLAGAVFRLTTTDGKTVTDFNGKPVTNVTTGTDGKAKFGHLPLGTYRVSEVTAPTGYVLNAQAQDMTLTKDTADGTVSLANSLERTTVKVAKTWSDNDNQDGQRPDSVTVRLLADGEVVDNQTLTLNAESEWKGSFSGLPKFKAGKEIAYTVSEDEVSGY
ncbi:MAG: Cna B-type domain-containing protein, partial [Actinomyces urogenitalis]|nr:Cna B-type domain-containing protein [Actinomyces urogenitalis]